MSTHRIICIPKGIHITYNGNETFKETIFSINTDNAIVQYFTFKCPIVLNNQELNHHIENITDKKEVLKGFLWYSFAYQVSFAHFVTQTLPLLTNYLQEYYDHKLLIPRHTYTGFQKDIIRLLKIPDDNIIFMDENILYNVQVLPSINHYESPPNTWSLNHIWIYKKLRESLTIPTNINPIRNIYLKKDGYISSSHGNLEMGITRKILNEELLIEMLKKYNFSIITLGQKSVEEKCELLNTTNILITQLGANCINLIFSNTPKNILLLSNDKPIGENYYVPLNHVLNDSISEYKCFMYPSDYRYSDPKNSTNCAFTVDIDAIEVYVQNCIMMV